MHCVCPLPPSQDLPGEGQCHTMACSPHPQKPSMFDVSRELGSSVALYSRKVLIQTKATDILPKWLRFIRGTLPRVRERCPCGLVSPAASVRDLADSVLSSHLQREHRRGPAPPWACTTVGLQVSHVYIPRELPRLPV